MAWRTIERAKIELGGIAERLSSCNAGGGYWEWRLPGSAIGNTASCKAATLTTKCGGLA